MSKFSLRPEFRSHTRSNPIVSFPRRVSSFALVLSESALIRSPGRSMVVWTVETAPAGVLMIRPPFLRRSLLHLLALPACLAAQAPPAYQHVAVATRRIVRDRVSVSVYQGTKRVNLPRFFELVIVEPLGQAESLDRLLETSVLLVPSDKRQGAWNVYAEPAQTSQAFRHATLIVGQAEELTLPDNVFAVEMVLVSTRKSPVEVQADRAIYKLKPAEALLVLH